MKELFVEKISDLTSELVKNFVEKEKYFINTYELTSTEYKFLYNFQFASKVAVKDLAKALGVTPARITHIITALEKRALISRAIDANDRRSILVSLTEQGIQLVKEITEYQYQFNSKIWSGINSESTDKAFSVIEELVQAVKKAGNNHNNNK